MAQIHGASATTQDVSGAYRTSSTRAAAVVLLTSGLSVVVPLLLCTSIPDVGRSRGWIITLLILAWAGFRLSVQCVDGRPRLFDFFFWLFVYIFMGLSPTIQIRANEISATTPGMNPALDVTTALLVVAGLACYEIGRLASIARKRSIDTGTTVPETPTDSKSTPRGVSGTKTAMLTAFGLLATGYVVSKVGIAVLLNSREAASEARNAIWPDSAIGAIVDGLSTYPLLIAVGALAQLRYIAATSNRRRAATVVFAFALVVLLVTTNPISSARYAFGTVAFAVVVYLGFCRTPLRVRLTMTATLFGFLFLFPLADAFRRIGETGGTQRNGFYGEYLGNPDYDAFWQITNAYTYWHLDSQPFHQLLGCFFFWVPRSVWPGKPVDTGILLAHYRGYPVENLSAPLWAESLINGGVVAVFVVFLAFGFALHRLDTHIYPVFRRGGVWVIAGAVFPAFMTILLRGSLLQATGPLTIAIACVLFVRAGPEQPPPGRGLPAAAQSHPW